MSEDPERLLTLFDVGDLSIPTGERARLYVDRAPVTAVAAVTVGCWEDNTESARGASVVIDHAQLNWLHEQIGRVLLEASVTARSPMGVESEAQKELHRARTAMRTAFERLTNGEHDRAALILAEAFLISIRVTG